MVSFAPKNIILFISHIFIGMEKSTAVILCFVTFSLWRKTCLVAIRHVRILYDGCGEFLEYGAWLLDFHLQDWETAQVYESQSSGLNLFEWKNCQFAP